MNQRRLDPTDPTGRHDVLAQIREGMPVFDSTNDRIGTVDYVHFGAASETQQELGTGAASPGPADGVQMRDDSWVDMLAEAFSPDDVPEELSSKLLQKGFIRLDTDGLFARDRFITPDQIVGVTGDGVQLAVARDQLIKRM